MYQNEPYDSLSGDQAPGATQSNRLEGDECASDPLTSADECTTDKWRSGSSLSLEKEGQSQQQSQELHNWGKCCKWISQCCGGKWWDLAERCLQASVALGLPCQVGLHDLPNSIKLHEIASEHIKQVRAQTRPQDVVGIAILGTGNLSDEPDIIHPIVRVHLVDVTTGQYLERPQAPRSIAFTGLTTYHERISTIHSDSLKYTIGVDETNIPVERILPIATAPCHLKGRSIAPVWNESRVVDMPFNELLNPNVLLLFEIVDFNHIQSHSTRREHTDGLYGLAWAYLRPLGPRGDIYVGARHLATETRKPEAGDRVDWCSDETELSIRLQLYDYKALSPLARYQARIWGISPPPAPTAPHVPAVYLQYLRKCRARYTSTLLVKVHPVARPPDSCVKRRPLYPNEKEISDTFAVTLEPHFGSNVADTVKKGDPDARSLRAVCRQRYAAECCVLPDRLLCRINSGARGALTIQFSPKGRLLAIAAVELLVYPIRLYDATGLADGVLPRDVPSAAAAASVIGLQVDRGREGAILLCDLEGHHGLVYDLRFTDDERFLLSASADGLAKVWDLGALAALSINICPSHSPHILCIFRESVAHYIYAAAFIATISTVVTHADKEISKCEDTLERQDQQRDQTYVHEEGGSGLPYAPYNLSETQASTMTLCPPVLTGAYSGAIAFWDPSYAESRGLLGGEIAHAGRVHCIEVDRRSGRVYSGDSTGTILVWRRHGRGDCVDHFIKIRVIKNPEFAGKPIMSMQLHPKRRRGQLLVQAQASTLKLIDLTTAQAVAHFKGNFVRRAMIRAKFSPEGKLVMAGSEDGKVHAWDSTSATPVLLPVSHLGYNAPVCDLSWHPTQHVVAFTCYGGDHPILIYFADRPENPNLLVDKIAPGNLDVTQRKMRLNELQARRKLNIVNRAKSS